MFRGGLDPEPKKNFFFLTSQLVFQCLKNSIKGEHLSFSDGLVPGFQKYVSACNSGHERHRKVVRANTL
jgi:hypothetical protein